MLKEFSKNAKILLCIISFSLIFGCNKTDEKVRNENLDKNSIQVDIGKSDNAIIERFKQRGDVQIISSDLIILTEIETNRNQNVNGRGAYQCSVLNNKLIRLSDLKELKGSDVFNNASNKVAESIINGSKSFGLTVEENDRNKIIDAIENADFKIINNKEFNFIEYDPIWQSCDLTVFEKNIPFKIIEPFLNDWFKKSIVSK